MSRRRKPNSPSGFVYRPKVTRTDKSGKKVTTFSRFYWARYRNENGDPVQEALKNSNGQGITDKTVAQKVLQNRLEYVQRAAAGLIDRYVENAKLPMQTVITRYIRHLKARCGTELHATKTQSRIEWVMAQGKVTRLGEFRADRVSAALDALATGEHAPMTRNPMGERLGRSPKTINEYRAAVYGLGKWAAGIEDLIPKNPVDLIPVRSANGDIRKKRRALTADEALRLLSVSGPRSLWYETLLLTGLRVAEIEQLQWGDLRLDANPPCIELRAGTTKARREDTIPMRKYLAARLEVLRPSDAKPTDHVFRTTPTRETFRRDCDRAEVNYRPDQRGRTVDRHALRTTFITWLSVYGTLPRTAQMLARHSDLQLTMGVYTDTALLAGSEAIETLPDLSQAVPKGSESPAKTIEIASQSVAPDVALECVIEGLEASAPVTETFCQTA